MVNLLVMGLKILHNIVPFLEALGGIWRKWRGLARDILVGLLKTGPGLG